MKWWKTLCLSIVLVGCAGGNVQLKELQKGQKDSCEIIDKVEVETDKGDQRFAIKLLKEKTLDLKGNAYSVDETISNGKNVKILGSVFSCKE